MTDSQRTVVGHPGHALSFQLLEAFGSHGFQAMPCHLGGLCSGAPKSLSDTASNCASASGPHMAVPRPGRALSAPPLLLLTAGGLLVLCVGSVGATIRAG